MHTLCKASIMAPLTGAELEVSSNRKAYREFQESLIVLVKRYQDTIDALPSIDWLRSTDINKLRKFARKHNIQLDTQTRPSGEVVLGMFRVAVKWRRAKSATTHKIDGVTYPYVVAKKVRQFKHKMGTIYEIDAKGGYTVWLMVSEFTIPANEVGHIKLHYHGTRYVDLHFPMVALQEQVELKPLIGMLINDNAVEFAKQKNIIEWDEKGVKVDSDTKIHTKGIPSPPIIIIIDRPFHMWMTNKVTNTLPLISAHIDRRFWRRPSK